MVECQSTCLLQRSNWHKQHQQTTIRMSNRIFRRLDFARACLDPHPFFLNQMAYLQMQNDGPFISGPMMCADPAIEEYSYWDILQRLDHGLRYFMRPHTLVAFGFNERGKESHLLTRAWLQHIDGHNLVVATVERVDAATVGKYMNSLNYKTIWKPTLEDCVDATAIKQTQIQQQTIMELQ